jgi:hypothetical protein
LSFALSSNVIVQSDGMKPYEYGDRVYGEMMQGEEEAVTMAA